MSSSNSPTIFLGRARSLGLPKEGLKKRAVLLRDKRGFRDPEDGDSVASAAFLYRGHRQSILSRGLQ